MRNAHIRSRWLQSLLVLFLVSFAGQTAAVAQDADGLDLVRGRFSQSSALDWAVNHHRLGDPSNTLVLLSWSLSDKSRSGRTGWITLAATSGSAHHRFGWSTSLTGRKDLSDEDMGAIRNALGDLPESSLPDSVEYVVLASYWLHNRWTHRVYDRQAPPAALMSLVSTAGLSVLVASDHAPN